MYEDEDPVLICNQAYCKLCNELVISHSHYDFKSCKCGSISVDGGLSYTRRLFRSKVAWEERSIYSDAPFEVIRENTYRGNRGRDGNQPLKWIKLVDIDDEYLDAIIQYKIDMGQTDDIHQKIYLQEREYRKVVK